jgi:hypothetical protein
MNKGNILIIHQQVAADMLRQELERKNQATIVNATWFSCADELRRNGDVQLCEEDDFCSLADTDRFDVIIGDAYFKRALPHFKGQYIDFPHFAVSGRVQP